MKEQKLYRTREMSASKEVGINKQTNRQKGHLMVFCVNTRMNIISNLRSD